MGQLTRTLNWSVTSLGAPDQWPQSLRTTLSIILNSRFPMFLFWGPTHLCFYNDAYRPSLGNDGKHPNALGKPGAQVWPEIWAFIKPLIDQVLSGQGATWNEDQLLPIYRNGRLEDVYWTFSYSPVSDESGNPAGVFVTCSETTQAVVDRQALLRNQERFYNLMTNAPVAIALFRGPEFVIDLANERVLQYWGRGREQVMDKPLFEALPEASGQGFEELLTQVFTTGERFIAKELTVNLERNGQLSPTFIDFVYEPYRETDGTITGIVVVCIEITEQVLARRTIEQREEQYRLLAESLEQQVQLRTLELAAANEELAATNEELAATNEELTSSNETTIAVNDELNQANRLLERSNENLEQFAYLASHDLQEPLRKIQQFGDLLIKTYQEPLGDGVFYLERMQQAAGRMSTLIRDLLTFSHLTTPQNPSTKVALSSVIKSVLTDLELRIQETGADILLDPLPLIEGDRSQLEQLFLNLLSNALKFRKPAGKPMIRIMSRQVTSSHLPSGVKPSRLARLYHQIDVSDNGIGFDEKHQERIFQMFQRLHGKHEFAGTGIGLAICEKVVTNHGGAITATSQPGQGATFSVYLPV